MLTEAEIKRLIDDDITSERKQYAQVGQRYYEGVHDILKTRLFYYNADGVLCEDKTRSNIKISHPFFTELADQFAAYMLSCSDKIIKAKEKVDGLQDHLDKYFDGEFWGEISECITDAYIKGFAYVYGYMSEENRIKFECADSMGVVEVREKDTDDGCKYFIYWHIDRIDKGKKKIKRILVFTEKEIHYFVQVDNGKVKKDDSVPVNPRPHVVYVDDEGQRSGKPLEYIPFWGLDYNKKCTSGLKPIKAIIDDYDLHACSLSNNLVDFDTPIHVVSGFKGDNLDELITNLKTKKTIGVGEGGGVAVQTVAIPYEARKTKLEIDEKNIYKFGMGLNTAALKDTNATTNLAIKAAYSLLELKARKFKPRVESFLKKIVKVVLDEINDENQTDFQLSDVVINIDFENLTNETENLTNEKVKSEIKQIEVNTILNVAAQIGDEQALKALCEVLDIDFEDVKGQLELMTTPTTANARAALEGAVIDGETIVNAPVE